MSEMCDVFRNETLPLNMSRVLSLKANSYRSFGNLLEISDEQLKDHFSCLVLGISSDLLLLFMGALLTKLVHFHLNYIHICVIG